MNRMLFVVSLALAFQLGVGTARAQNPLGDRIQKIMDCGVIGSVGYDRCMEAKKREKDKKDCDDALAALKAHAAASHNILERARCNSNARDPVSPMHTPHPAARLAFIRISHAVLRAVARSATTESPVPKNISSGV